MMRAFLVKVPRKDCVRNVAPEDGVHLWVKYETALEELDWSHSLLTLERAKDYLKAK